MTLLFYESLSLFIRDEGDEMEKPVIAALKSKGISSIGAAGFCWGELAFKGLSCPSTKLEVIIAPDNYIVVL
ncbi:hypothetical protein IFM89_000711 [Coptis chinensis]|uniref:Dienelactone hydrolase domain-containing protein n=1 Tax=Coptis chinensis TaxID=261450 RepID=A0A835IVW0_9MAGN|nr:hypothetical protein IFM89_000711 [Coptis chinensis]